MGAPNARWEPWIVNSFGDYFNTFAESENIEMFMEGQVRETSGERDWIELRVDGPYFTEVSKGVWDIFVEVNVLVGSILDETVMDKIRGLTGKVSAQFASAINIFKYGDESGDDESLWTCMRLVSPDRIVTTHFGQVSPGEELLQATVEGHYRVLLTE